MKEFVADAAIENLPAVMDFINGELKDKICSAKLLMEINMAIEEIFVNIASYAYAAGEAGTAAIRIDSGDKIIIELEDSGKAYNPLCQAEPDIGLSTDKRLVGGLGVFMVKQIMDNIEYRYADGKNLLIMQKALE